MSVESVEAKMDGLKELFKAHEVRQDEQFAALKEYFIVKLESVDCDDCIVHDKVKSLEDSVKTLQDATIKLEHFKYTLIGAFVIIEFVAVYIINLLLH